MIKRMAKEPERTCLGCRAKKPQSTLIRLALDNSRVVFDHDRALGGRGGWLCRNSAACLSQVLKKNAWGRFFRSPEPFDLSVLRIGLEVTGQN